MNRITSKEALELAILDSEKDLEEDENNQWVKNVLKALKECQKDLDRLEIYEKFTIPNLKNLILKLYNNEELTREEYEIIFEIMSLKNEVLENERKRFKN